VKCPWATTTPVAGAGGNRCPRAWAQKGMPRIDQERTACGGRIGRPGSGVSIR
jgi:hypothetical protein